MSDLISRQAAIDAIENAFDRETILNRFVRKIAISAVRLLPSAQPEIIRCKDCKHRIEHKHYGDLGESAYTCEGNMVGWILPDGFCSFAERRTDE